MLRRGVLSYFSYAACTYHGIEVEAKQSNFAQLRKCSRFLPVAANLLGHSNGRACTLDASVGGKLFVVLGFVGPFHSFERIAREHTKGVELPVALGTTEALEILAPNPFQRALHAAS
jgi:hypothetical protein